MSNTDTHTSRTSATGSHADTHGSTGVQTHAEPRRVSTETKASFKTSELAVFIAAVVAVLIASAIVDTSDFGAQEAWRYVTFLTVGYLLSRGLAKSGSREHYDADSGTNNR